MNCSSFTLTPGDVLYLPKSVIHFATTDPGVVASHLTISLSRSGRTWQEVVKGMCELTGHPLCGYINILLDKHVSTDAGLPWLDLVDGTLPCQTLQQLVLGFQPSSLRSALQAIDLTASYVNSRDIDVLLARLGSCSSELGVKKGTVVQVLNVLTSRSEVCKYTRNRSRRWVAQR